jgi:hypothetical protein
VQALGQFALCSAEAVLSYRHQRIGLKSISISEKHDASI